MIILLILLASLFVGGGASTVLTFVQGHTPAEVKKVVKKEVADEKRKDAALEIIDEWAKEDKKQDKALGKERKELLKIVTRYDAQRTETEPLTARIDASIHEADRRFLDMRFQLKEQLTKAEWDAAVVRLNQ